MTEFDCLGAILCTEHQTERHLINQTFNQWGILEQTLFFLFPSSIRCYPNDHFDYLILSVLCVFPCCRPSLLSHGHGTFSRHNSLSVCHGHGTFSRHNSLSVMDMGPLAGTTVLVHAMDMGPLAGTTVLVHAMDTR